MQNCKKDVFSNPDYLDLFSEFENNEIIYFFYGEEKNYILLPFFKRPIKTVILEDEKNNYFDLVSPWYYGGPIHNIEDRKLLNFLFQELMEEIDKYCKSKNIFLTLDTGNCITFKIDCIKFSLFITVNKPLAQEGFIWHSYYPTY